MTGMNRHLPTVADRIAASGLFLVVALVAIVIDLWLVVESFNGGLGPAVALGLHGLVALAAGFAISRVVDIWQEAVPFGLWILLMGPLGATAVTILFVTRFWRGERPAAGEEWVRLLSGRPDTADDLLAALHDGRAYRVGATPLATFHEVMASGSVRDRQAVLGLIAQRYEPAFQGLLMTALNSPDVAVRASAAAVLARLRDRQAETVKSAGQRAASDDPADRLAAAEAFEMAAISGLADAGESRSLAEKAAGLRRAVVTARVVPLLAHPALYPGRADASSRFRPAPAGARSEAG